MQAVTGAMVHWWYRFESLFKTRIAFPCWFREYRPSDAPRLSEQFVMPPSGIATQVQQLTRGPSNPSESSFSNSVCRSAHNKQRSETLVPPMADMQLDPILNNANNGGNFGGTSGATTSTTDPGMCFTPEVRPHPMDLEPNQARPTFWTGMAVPPPSAYVTPTMRNSPPPPPTFQAPHACAPSSGPFVNALPGQIITVNHPYGPPPKQTDWSFQFHLRDALHRQYIVLKCNNHNPMGLLGVEANYYPEPVYLRGPYSQGHFMFDVRPGLDSIFQAYK